MEVHQSPMNYLNQNNNPKLLLFCGHITPSYHYRFYQPIDENYSHSGWIRDENTGTDNDDGLNLRGDFMHQHRGWYTVDQDIRKYPDLVANLYQQETIDYLSNEFGDRMNIVYLEGWETNLFQLAYNVLKPGGFLVSCIVHTGPVHMNELYNNLSSAGFDLNRFNLYDFRFICQQSRRIREAIQQLPPVDRIEEINLVDLIAQIISNAEYYYPEEVPIIQNAIDNQSIYTTLTNLSIFSQIHPSLGWGLSFEHRRCYYFWIQK